MLDSDSGGERPPPSGFACNGLLRVVKRNPHQVSFFFKGFGARIYVGFEWSASNDFYLYILVEELPGGVRARGLLPIWPSSAEKEGI